VGGYAYVGRTAEYAAGGRLHVVLLSPAGEGVMDEPHERTSRAQEQLSAVTRARGMFGQPELGRLVVRVDHERSWPDGEEWWAYGLVRGNPLFRARPKAALGEPDVQYACGVAPIPGTPLVLVSSIRPDPSRRERIPGALFQLLDADLREVWRLELPDDHVPASTKHGYALLDEIRREGAILATAHRAFELRHLAEALRVRYAVERSGSAWSVVEVAREAHAAARDDGDAPELPTFVPTLRSEVFLDDAASIDSPGTSTIDSAFGRIVIQDERTRAFHVFEATGKRVLLARAHPDERDELRRFSALGCTPDGGIIAGESPFRYRYVRFGPDGVSRGIEVLNARMARLAPRATSIWGVKDAVLVRLGPGGELLASLLRRPDGLWWRDITDVVCAADGSVAVLDLPVSGRDVAPDPAPAVIARFDAEGDPLTQHELPAGVPDDTVARIEHAGDWVLVDTYGHALWLLDVRDDTSWEVALEAEPEGGARVQGLSPAGDELWVLHAAERRLRTYSLPD
jgi:hypothetical protein